MYATAVTPSLSPHSPRRFFPTLSPQLGFAQTRDDWKMTDAQDGRAACAQNGNWYHEISGTNGQIP